MPRRHIKKRTIDVALDVGMSDHQVTLPKQLLDKGLIEQHLFSLYYRRELETSKRGVSAKA